MFLFGGIQSRPSGPVPLMNLYMAAKEKGADVALCGGDGEFLLYVKGKQVCKVSEEDAAGKVIEYALSLR